VDTLAGDRALRDRLGQCARAGYEAYYTDESYLTAYLALIASISDAKSAVGHTGGGGTQQ
jgi:hypothetical protein